MKITILTFLIISMFTILFSKNHSNEYFDKSKEHHTPHGFTNPFLSDGPQNKNFYDLIKMMHEKRPDKPKKIKVEEISSSEIEDLIKKG